MPNCFWFWAPTWLPSALLTPRLVSVEVKFTFLVWSICVLEAFWDGARSDRAITSFWVYEFWDTKWLGPLRFCVTRVLVCNKHHELWIQTAWIEPVRVCVWAICVDVFCISHLWRAPSPKGGHRLSAAQRLTPTM